MPNDERTVPKEPDPRREADAASRQAPPAARAPERGEEASAPRPDGEQPRALRNLLGDFSQQTGANFG